MGSLKADKTKAKPLMAYTGGKVYAWQVQARAKLKELLCVANLDECCADVKVIRDIRADGVRSFRFTLTGAASASCTLCIPECTEAPTVMAVLSKGIESLYPDFCRHALTEGFALAYFDEITQNTNPGEKVLASKLLLDALCSHFKEYIDTSRICVCGDAGDLTPAYLGALDPRASLVMPVCALGTCPSGTLQKPEGWIDGMEAFFSPADLIAMAAPKYYVQISASDDSILPIENAEHAFLRGRKAYEAQGEEHRCTLVKGTGERQFFPELACSAIHKYPGK